jgi:hypothetical protein
MAVLDRNGVTVSEKPGGNYVLAKGTDLLVVPLQAVVSRQMLLTFSETFYIPIAEFYQRPLPLH